MIKFCDRAPIGQVKRTQEGYLIATSRVARTGIQEYRASELGFVGDHIVRVLRPESEVFSDESIKSLTRVPVTLEHPSVMVDADNWKDLAVGEVGDGVMRDGEWIVVNPMIKDAKALAAAATTHKEISMGYQADIVDAEPDSGADYVMTNLRFNHLALVPRGRAGSQARIGDAQTWGASPITVEDKEMTVELKTVILGDKAVQVEAKDAATVAAIVADHAKTVADKDAEIGRLTAELEDAKSKVLSDEAIAKMVKDMAEAEKRREAVRAKFGDEVVKDASDAMIEGMYKVLDKSGADNGMGRAVANASEVKDADKLIADAIAKRFNLGGK